MIESLMLKENNPKLNIEQFQCEQEQYKQRESERTIEKVD